MMENSKTMDSTEAMEIISGKAELLNALIQELYELSLIEKVGGSVNQVTLENERLTISVSFPLWAV